jgi:glucan biosynthesis protein C
MPTAFAQRAEFGASLRDETAARVSELAPAAAVRYHALDGLRSTMMLLGLVVHAACTYTTFPLGESWPLKDQRTSPTVDLVLLAIHAFRMPVFMVMAGFFAALTTDRRGVTAFIVNRTRRILVPFVAAFFLLLPVGRWGAHYAHAVQQGAPSPWSVSLGQALNPPVVANLAHLWFLYDLLIFYGAVALVRPLVPASWRAAVGNLFRRAFGLRWGIGALPFLFATTALTCFMPHGVLATNLRFTPDFLVLGVYFTFFGFGWLLHAERDRLALLEGRLVVKGVVSLVLVVAQLVFVKAGQKAGVPGEGPYVIASALSGMAAAWVGFYFWAGLFVRAFDRPSRTIRYLTDASYAVYLVHVPLSLFAAGLLARWDAPGLVKMLAVLGSITAASLAIYATLVRSTFIGEWLNGRRYR